MTQTPTDSSTGPDRTVANAGCSASKETAAWVGHNAVLEKAVRDRRAKRYASSSILTDLERSDRAYVDENRRKRQPQIQERNETLTSGDNLCLVPVLFQEIQGLFDRCGMQVDKGRGLHEAASCAA
ncbi:hypothetical protein GCM10027062_45360 [Nocardioides hungaricus]